MVVKNKQFAVKGQEISKNVKKIKEEGPSFQTLVDAISYMSSRGWEYVETVVSTQEEQMVYSVFMRKKGKRKR